MQLIELLDYVLGAIINTMCYIIIMKKVFSTKLNSKKFKIYIPMVIGSFVIAIMNIQNKDMFKPVFTIPIMALIISFMTSQNFLKSFFMTICCMIYLFISEIILATIVSIFDIKSLTLLDGVFGGTIGNILIAFLTILIINISPIKKKLNKFLVWIQKEQKFGILIILLFFVGALASRNAFNLKNTEMIITNLVLTIIFFIILMLLLNEHQKKEDISNSYNMLFSYLKVYEDELVEKRKLIHDYNNELIVIRSYTHNNNYKLKNYVTSIINEQKNVSNNVVVQNSDKIPKGLKGLICYKLSSMSKEIKLEICTDKSSKEKEVPEYILKDVLKITGILLDNAIEAAKDSKEKEIFIKIKSTTKNLQIEFINSFEGKIDENNIFSAGYTTKGSNRGYGLALVKDIINKNPKIKITTKILNNKFVVTQNIKTN